jgi:hypothetical protein
MDLPRAAEQARATIILLRVLGTGEDTAGGSRNAQITAAVFVYIFSNKRNKQKVEKNLQSQGTAPIEPRIN